MSQLDILCHQLKPPLPEMGYSLSSQGNAKGIIYSLQPDSMALFVEDNAYLHHQTMRS